MVDKYDRDGTGEIEFEEFLHIMEDLQNKDQKSDLQEFFQYFAEGTQDTSGLPFHNFVLTQQRKHLINAIVIRDEQEAQRQKGRQVLAATKNMLANK